MSTAADSLTLRVQAEQIADAYPSHLPGHHSYLANPDKLQVFLAAIQDGNYRETSCKLAGFSKMALKRWLDKAEAGDEAAMAFRDALEKAEATAESETVRNVRAASKLPQFWAAGMTYLERKHPERWGRRQEDSAAPKVIVQIGARDSDVTINVLSPPVSEDLHRLTDGNSEI